MAYSTAPPACSVADVSFPTPSVMLVTINRERALNAITMAGHTEGAALWQEEGVLRGADLVEQKERNRKIIGGLPSSGFFGISTRVGKKPIIAAVNGFAFGGGFEIVLNCDLVIASPTATFTLPEAKWGLYAAAGGLARAVRTFGMQLAAEMAIAGRVLSAEELQRLGFLRVAASQETLLEEAMALAAGVARMSPDAVIVSRAGLRQAWETGSVQRAAQITDEQFGRGLMEGQNARIGLEAFAAKREPEWVPSKL
ncbi:unnamed protein product [Parascedosporium putredinis]|uniref:Enoyl-CoA hydratase n=1 Tax=Parascedosporium putredinis TaxID=1442378 RepID=A0A9P1H0T4_9PEZI|nr:unnamed protein product [Parascedosporium putredinis]CAI7993105.1 unnamed protein product [Parascedosporium putredinis]